MQAYKEVDRKYNNFLDNAQRKLLQERAKTLSIGNAPQRMDMQTSAIRGRRQQNEMLSNYGLASSLNRNASSGADETARRMSGFQSSMQQLRAHETAQLDQYGYQYAQETIAARQRAAAEAAAEEERRRRAAAAAAARKKAAAQNQKAAQNAIGFVNEAVKNGMSEDQAAKYMSALYTGDAQTAAGVEKQYVGSAQHNFEIAAVAEIDKSVAAGVMDRRAGEYIAQQIQQKNYGKAQHGLSVARIDATKRISASTQEALKSGKITQKQATAINTALINGNLTVANIALQDYQRHQELMTRSAATFNQDLAASKKEVKRLEKQIERAEGKHVTRESNLFTGETKDELKRELAKEEANLETLRQYQALRTQEQVDAYSALDIDTLNNLEAQFEAEKKLILESGHANGKTDYDRETEIGEKLNAIGQAKQNITLAARQAEYEAIQAEVIGQADFQAQSAIGAELQEYDTVHASINGHSDIIAQKMALEGDIAGGKVVRSDLETAGLMNDDEKAAYNYYYAKGGLEAARGYLASIETHLNQRRAEQIELMATYRTNGRDLSVFMNEIEQATYTAYIAQRGESAAEEYLASLEPVLKERRGDVLIDRELPAWMGATTQSIASILATPAEFVGTLYSMKQTLLGEEIDPYDRAFTASIYKNAVRNSVANEIAQNIYDEGGSEVLAEALAFGYQTAMSIGDNLLMVYLGGAVGKVAGAAGASVKGANLAREIYQLGTMSLGAAASTTQSLIARGVSEDQAMAVGFAAGVFEAIFEKVSLDNLLDMPTQQVVPWLRRTLTQAGVEATEEFCTEVANTITNNIVLGDQSDFNAAVAEYMRQGKTFAEAQSQAMIDIMVNIGLAAAGGFLSGGLLGGSSAFRQDLQTKKIGAAIQEGQLGGTQSLLDEASKVTDDKVQKLYAKLNNAYTHNQTLSNLEVGRLNYMVANNGLSQVRTQIDALETEGEIDSKTAKQLKEIAEEMALGGQTPVHEDGFLYGKIREAVDAVETRVQEEAAAAEQPDETWTENVAEDFVMMPTRENIETDPDKVRKQMGIARNVSERFDLDVKQSYKEDGGMTVSLHKADSIDGLTAHQKGMLQFARAIQKMGVVDVVVHDSLDVNGAFDPETNTMHIALDAESTIGAMAHELTHYIKKNAPEQYEALEKFLKEQANKARRNGWEQLVREKMAQYKQEGMSEEKLRRLGESEAAAAMCEDMLRDEAKIREFVQRDMTLGEKVLNFIDDVLKNFKSILSGDTHHSEASTLIADIEQARKLWFDALQAAKERKEKNTETLQESRKRYAPRPVEEMTRKEYNKYGWADVNRVVSKKEQARFLEMIGKKQIGDVFPTVFGDKYAIAVRDESDTGSVVFITDGEFKKPSIDMVIRSAKLSTVQAEELWRDVYNVVGYETAVEAISNAFGNESIQIFSNDSVQSYEEFRRSLERKNGGSIIENTQSKDQRRRNDKTDEQIVKMKAPDNGAFFDADLSRRAASDQESILQVLERAPTPEGLTLRKENEDLSAAVQAFERTVRRATELQKDGSYRERETDIPEAAELIAAAVHHNPTFAYRDVARNLDAFAKNNTHLRAVLRDTIERPFNAAGGVYSVNLKSRSEKFLEEIAKLGIETKEESAAVQRIGEGYYQDEYGEQQIYTMEMLKEQFPEKWKNIVQAAELTRKIYDGYIDELNRMLEKIYPNVIEHAETDYRNAHSYTVAAEERVSNQMRHVGKIEYRIEQLQKQLDGKKRTDTKAYTQLENSLAREKARLRNAEALLELYEQKAAVRRIQEKEIEEAAASGEILRNRRVLKRADYFHHFTEMEQGFGALMNILRTNFEIDPALAGKTSQTKPKAKLAGFMQHRGEGAYVEDAINGMLRYMALAEYKLAYDPLAEHLRNVELTVRRAAESGDTKNTNANSFLQWIGEWRNGILGKSSGLDRALSDTGMLGRKAVQVARWVNNRVKSNAILGNARSAIVQVSNVTNGATYIKNPKDWTDGMRLAIQMNYGQNREELQAIMEQSEFMTQRYMDIPVFADTSSTPKKFALAMLNAGDKASAQLMWWSAYNQFQRNPNVGDTLGAGGFDAVQYADEVVRRSVGGRGVGEQPIVLNSQIINMIAPFQTEVTNTFNNMREQLGKKNWEGLMAFEVTTFALNSVFSALFGDRPLPFDFISAIWAAMQDLGDDEEPWYKDVVNAAKRFGGEIAAGIPFGTQLASFLLGAEASEQFFGEADPTRYGTGNMGFQAIAESVIETGEFAALFASGKFNSVEEAWVAVADRTNLLKVALPWGGAQVARSIAGIDAVARGYSQKLNKAGELEAQFAVDGNLLKGVQAAAFGKWSLKEAQEYLDGGSTMSAETTAEMKEAKAAGIAPTQFAEIRADMRDIKPIKNDEDKTEVTAVTQKMELLRDDASLTDAQRLLMLKQVDTDGNYYADATEAYTRGVSVSDYLEYVTAKGRMQSIKDDEGKTVNSISDQLREKLLADTLLSAEQKATLDELLTDSEKIPDYTSEERFRLSEISESQYNRALTAERSGVSNAAYLKYYRLDADEKTKREDVYRAIMADKSLNAKQKAALETALFQTEGKKYTPKDYTDEAHFYITHEEGGTLYPMKLELAEKQGFSYKKVAEYVKRYQTMKDNKDGSGKNGAVKKKDSYAIMADMGFTKAEQNQLYKIMTTKEADLKEILGK